MKLKILSSIARVCLNTRQAAFSLVEIILANAVFALLLVGLVGIYLYGQESSMTSGNRNRAILMAEEGLEAVKNIADASFSNLVDGTYGLTTTTSQWNLVGLSDVRDIFTRQINISTVDSKRKAITSTVTWQQNLQRNGLVSLTSRITNWVVSSIGNWANPMQSASIDLPSNSNSSKIQVQGNYVYVVNNSAGVNFYVIDVTNLLAPTIVASLALAGVPNNIYVAGNYAYIASSDNSSELQIIDISVAATPLIVGNFNADGNADAYGVFVVGNTAHLVRASSASDEYITINVTNHTLPTLIGSLNLSANGYEVVVSGNYAYVASASNSQELQVVDVTNLALPTLTSSLNMTGNSDALSIAISGDTVLLGQANFLHTINVTNPIVPVLLGSINVIATLNDIALNLAGNYVFVATGENAAEFKVIDISTLASPTILSSVDIIGNSGLLGIAYDSILDRAFGASVSNNEEFVIFAPQ